jgi:hypothetical protein
MYFAAGIGGALIAAGGFVVFWSAAAMIGGLVFGSSEDTRALVIAILVALPLSGWAGVSSFKGTLRLLKGQGSHASHV